MTVVQVSEHPDEDVSMHSASAGEESEMDELESDVEQPEEVRTFRIFFSQMIYWLF
jgi:hypothetical protein